MKKLLLYDIRHSKILQHIANLKTAPSKMFTFWSMCGPKVIQRYKGSVIRYTARMSKTEEFENSGQKSISKKCI